MAADLKVVQGSFDIDEENALVIAELEKWLQRAKDRKIIAFSIAAIAADQCVLTQFSPSYPKNAFALYGAACHAAQRVWAERIEE